MRRRRTPALAAVLALVASVLAVVQPAAAPSAQAADTISLTRTVAAQSLYGAPIPVTITATNTLGADLFNLSFTDVLPAGATVAGGTAPDQQIPLADGTTLLVWNNVSDLQDGTTSAISYTFTADAAVYGLGDTLPGTAHAYANSDERIVPVVSPADGKVSEYTAEGEATSETQLVPFTVKKTLVDVPENEIPRGSHDHKVTYRITITNNLVVDSEKITLDDWLPAGLEFLGCTNVDNSRTRTEEYPGSGDLTNGAFPTFANPCLPRGATLSASTVVEDPDGSGDLPEAVYTRATWQDLGSLRPGDVLTIEYAAAVPMLENVAMDPAVEATANLDNNEGSPTADEQRLVNYAAASGTTRDRDYLVGASETATAEDLAVQKSVDTPVITQGAISTWTLAFEASEYTVSTDRVSLADVLPDGLAYAGTTTGPREDSVADQPDGTEVVRWTLDPFRRSETRTVVFTTKTLDSYRVRAGGGPVAAGDAWTNTVSLESKAVVLSDTKGGTSDVAITDASAAGQEAQTVEIDKEVAEPQASVTGRCDTIATWEDSAVGATHGFYRPGDIVCFRLTIDFPDGVDTIDARTRDVLPPGFTYLGFAPTALNRATWLTDPSNDPSGRIRWTFDNNRPGEFFQVVVASRWTDPNASAPGAVQGNLQKMRWQNTAGTPFQLRDLADIQLAKPVLAVEKSVTPTTAAGGQTVTYSVVVTNIGNAPAQAAVVTDTLPTGWTCADITPPAGATCANGVLTLTGIAVPAAGATTVSFTGRVPTSAAAADTYTNTATLTSYASPTNDRGSYTYTPGTDAPASSSQATVTVPTVTVAKTATPANPTIGETVTYTITASVPANTTLYGSPRLVDTVPTGIDITGTTYTVAGVDRGSLATTSGRTVTATLPGGTTYANTTASPQSIVLTITGRVADTAANTRGGVKQNSATFTWTGSPAAGSTPRSVTSNTTMQTIAEPLLSLTKTDGVGRLASPGADVPYTLTVGNTGTSSSYDTVITDLVPAQLTPRRAGGGLVSATGDVVDTTGSTAGVIAVWNSSTRTITFTLPVVGVGSPVIARYTARLDSPLVSNGAITNNASVRGTSRPGVVTGERTYTATASDTLTNPVIGLAKTAVPTSATVGARVTYTLTATVPAGTTAYDAVVADQLPAHVQFESLVGSTCTEGAGSCAITASVIGSPAASATRVGFWLDDIPSSTSVRTVRITYTGIVRQNAVRDETLANTAQVLFDSTDRRTTAPATIPTDSDVAGSTASATVQEVEPTLGVVKTVTGGSTGAGTTASPRRAKPGDALTYTVTVRNTGTSTAWNATLRDTLPALTPCATVTAISNGGTCANGVIIWTVPSIAAGASATRTYVVTVPATLTSSSEVAGPELVNTADVPQYSSLDTGDPANAGLTPRTYTEDPSARAAVELDLASIRGVLWEDWPAAGALGVRDAGDPRLDGVGIVVTFAGADGIFGTPDDEAHPTTTAGGGAWAVDRLPGGPYRVTVTTATLPAGLTASYDLDGITTPNVWSGSLGQSEDKTGVDFGYRGTGSIGDLVWFDRDGSGTRNGEPGLAGATVTLTTTGPGGAALTATTTTDANGAYLFPNLPAGSYTVTVTTPTGSGFRVVSDPDGTFDGVSTVSLGAGQNDLTRDFGLAGTGALGDRVWLDRDRDGVQNTGEPGLVGVTVTVTWLGLDGGAGGGDDAVFTTTTGADGVWTLTGLPAGAFTVAVTAGLPSNAAATYDLDGGALGTTAVTLTPGQIRTDVDFGYDADTSIGDFVWWDADRDGVQDAGEPGLPNVPITVVYAGQNGVFGDADDITYTTATDAAGAWTVTNISEGRYRVTATAPTGFAPTADSDSPAGTGDAVSVTTITAAGDTGQDFGFAGAGSIGDRVWLDEDGDGAQDAGEPGIPGVTVTLRSTVNGVIVTRTTTTGPDGSYTFAGVPVGVHTVSVDDSTVPGTSTATTAATRTVVLTPAAPSTTDVDFGFRGTSSLGDRVWYDRDGDGVQDAGENGIPNVTLTATWTDGSRTIVVTTTTGADGAYLFDGLPAGTWTIVPSGVPAGLTATFEHDDSLNGSDVEVLGAGVAERGADFGFSGGGTIGDTVWLDLNADGVRQAGEPGVPGQSVGLVWAGGDGVFGTPDDETFSTATDANGAYLFQRLPAGPFRVSVVGGIVGAAPNTGDPDGGGDSTAALTLAVGGSNLAQDFGYQGLNTLGDTVWWDRDGDGLPGGTDPGFAGVTVTVRWLGGDGVEGTADDLVRTATTDAAGVWTLTGLPDGPYRTSVTAGIPAGFAPVVDTGDAVPDGTSITTLGAAKRSDLGQDFGYRASGVLGDSVYLDSDGDGAQGPGEPGIPGATVTVVWGGPDGDLATAGDNVTWTTTTAPDGTWSVGGLPAGPFRVTVTGTPAGLADTGDPDGGGDSTAVVTLTPAGSAVADFGYRGGASIGQLVAWDLDGDGVLAPGAPGIAGVVVTVRSAGADGVLDTADDILTVRTTDAAGAYLADGLPGGATRVSYDPSALPLGGVAESDLDAADPAVTQLVLGATEVRTDVDFAVVGTGTLSSVVFDDRDADGVRDPGEDGVGGVRVIVTWAGPAGPVTIETVSRPDGSYALTGLPAGSYTVVEDPATFPAGYRPSSATARTVELAIGGAVTVPFAITTQALAVTGMAIGGGTVLLAALLLGAGGLLLVLRRRRTAAASQTAAPAAE